MGLETTTTPEDNPNKITLKVTDGVLKEIDRIRELTGFDIPTQFRKGYTLLRIFIDTYENGGEIYRKNSSGEEENLKLPGYNAPEPEKNKTD